MPKTVAKPYISGFGLNLNSFTLKQVGFNQRTNALVTVFGPQKPQMMVEQTLYLGQRNVGTQQYIFGEKATPSGASHNGLPPFSDILPVTSQAVTDWLAAIDSVLDAALPEYRDDSVESAATGPAIYLRINRIEAKMPWDKPEEQHIGVVISGYEDAAFTRQIEDIMIPVNFATDEFVKRMGPQLGAQGEMTDSQVAQVREQFLIFSLKDFLAQPGVQDGIVALGQSFFTTLKAHVYNFSEIDVPTIMSAFTLPAINS